jgi:uncharacterized membrane protein
MKCKKFYKSKRFWSSVLTIAYGAAKVFAPQIITPEQDAFVTTTLGALGLYGVVDGRNTQLIR